MIRDFKYYALLFSILLLFVLTEATKTEPVSWIESFSVEDKIPFGTHAALQIAGDVFAGDRIELAQRSIVETIGMTSATDADFRNYIFINSDFVNRGDGVDLRFDDLEVQTLLNYVAEGRRVFLSGTSFEGPLSDTLRLATSTRPFDDLSQWSVDALRQDTSYLVLYGAGAAFPDSIAFPSRLADAYFSSVDSSRATLLGAVVDEGQTERANFIRVDWGRGAFLIHTVPAVFSNYGIARFKSDQYAATVLSHLPVAPTLWDEYYKLTRGRGVRTPLRYILQTEPLRWAYAVAMASLLLFILFRGRRRQRIMPIVRPLSNTSLDFVKTVGRLYYQKGDHKDIAEKRIEYLLDYIRSHLNLDTAHVDDALVGKVSRRSGADEDAVKDLFDNVANIRRSPSVNKQDLLRFNDRLELFYDASLR